MVKREFWLNRIEKAWERRSIVWLSGVRRVGKTCLCQTLQDIEYFDCELPRVRRLMEDPQGFLDSINNSRIVLDEIHRLPNPSELLKIAADHYPDIQIVATGSSTLGASAKFRDTLAGRKTELWLTPIITEDLVNFNKKDIQHRLLHGGLPPFFLETKFPEPDFQEWSDAYWAKDIQELFRLERRYSFQKFTELLMTQSGGVFEATRFAAPCEVSRSTISNYLSVLEATFVVHVIRPFSSRRSNEIVAAPKVYGFDTGFVCFHQGWLQLRQEDIGLLWEHFVLNEMMAQTQSRDIRYWRDKRGHEVDFVLTLTPNKPIAVECKWSANSFSPRQLLSFRRQYPDGQNYVVSYDVDRTLSKDYNGISVSFVNLNTLIDDISQHH
ncbi:MAG: AAA family ATPase [Candidatus Poribacteria bacterium]|nr:AAA family ATPase [Candidatus Poribacteria bacterium]